MWWRLTPFFIVYAWLMAAIMRYFAYLGVRTGRPETSMAILATGTVIVFFAHWQRRRLLRARKRFDEQVAAYERVISEPI
jgi:hypothetical protein